MLLTAILYIIFVLVCKPQWSCRFTSFYDNWVQTSLKETSFSDFRVHVIGKYEHEKYPYSQKVHVRPFKLYFKIIRLMWITVESTPIRTSYCFELHVNMFICIENVLLYMFFSGVEKTVFAVVVFVLAVADDDDDDVVVVVIVVVVAQWLHNGQNCRPFRTRSRFYLRRWYVMLWPSS